VARPIAVAAYFTGLLEQPLPDGGVAVTFQLGAGSFEAAVLRRTGEGFATLATRGGDDLGGADLDAELAGFVRRTPPRGWNDLSRGGLDEQRAADAAGRRAARPGAAVPARRDARIRRRGLADPRRVRGDRRPAARPGAVAGPGGGGGGRAARRRRERLAGGVTATPLVARLLHAATGRAPVVLREPRFAALEGAMHLARTPRDAADGPELTWFDARRTYAVGGGHVSSTWYISPARPQEMIGWYRGRLGDHDEDSPGRWSRRRVSRGLRDVHHVTVTGTDAAPAGPAPNGEIPDHYRSLVCEESALLPDDGE
jgi:hypothetical protein